MWACGFEPAKALVRGLTATPTAAFRVRLGNYQPHRGSGAVSSRIAGKIPPRAGPFERERTSAGSSGGSHDPGWVGVWVGEGGWGVRRFLSRPKSAAHGAPTGQPGTRGSFEHPTALLRSHAVHCAFLSTRTVPVPHHAQRHSMSDTECLQILHFSHIVMRRATRGTDFRNDFLSQPGENIRMLR